MKHIFLNLKRFDVPVSYGGVNRIAPMQEWGSFIVKNTQDALKKYDPREVEFVPVPAGGTPSECRGCPLRK